MGYSMKRKPAYRYYCDFCKKSGGSGGHMKRHEQGCTKNPARVCRMCGHAGLKQKPLEWLVVALGNGDAEGVGRLRDASEGCPACMLAAICQSKLQRPYSIGEDNGFHVEFDFRKEKESFWAGVNQGRFERERSGY